MWRTFGYRWGGHSFVLEVVGFVRRRMMYGLGTRRRLLQHSENEPQGSQVFFFFFTRRRRRACSNGMVTKKIKSRQPSSATVKRPNIRHCGAFDPAVAPAPRFSPTNSDVRNRKPTHHSLPPHPCTSRIVTSQLPCATHHSRGGGEQCLPSCPTHLF